jgi:hypothetical protein
MSRSRDQHEPGEARFRFAEQTLDRVSQLRTLPQASPFTRQEKPQVLEHAIAHFRRNISFQHFQQWLARVLVLRCREYVHDPAALSPGQRFIA